MINIKRFFLYFVLIFWAIATITPFIWMFAKSLQTSQEFYRPGLNLLPSIPQWDTYVRVFNYVNFGRMYVNTIFVSVVMIVGQIIISSMAAFAFARIEFFGKNVLFMLFMSMLMIPTQATLIPNYILVEKMGLLDSYSGIILPQLFSIFGVFFLRQFFKGIPKSLDESAYIDGANPLDIYLKIIIPLSKSALVTFGILVLVFAWNSMLWPLIVVSSEDMYLLSIGISFFQGQFNVELPMMMAAAFMSTIPIVIIFLLAQKYFMEGVSLNSGIK